MDYKWRVRGEKGRNHGGTEHLASGISTNRSEACGMFRIGGLIQNSVLDSCVPGPAGLLRVPCMLAERRRWD